MELLSACMLCTLLKQKFHKYIQTRNQPHCSNAVWEACDHCKCMHWDEFARQARVSCINSLCCCLWSYNLMVVYKCVYISPLYFIYHWTNWLWCMVDGICQYTVMT